MKEHDTCPYSTILNPTPQSGGKVSEHGWYKNHIHIGFVFVFAKLQQKKTKIRLCEAGVYIVLGRGCTYYMSPSVLAHFMILIY
jgi:hypothetical protein